MSVLAFPQNSSQRAEACKTCRVYPLKSNFIHMTPSEFALAVLGGDVAYGDGGVLHGVPYTLPLNSESRWIHVLEEENADLGSH